MKERWELTVASLLNRDSFLRLVFSLVESDTLGMLAAVLIDFDAFDEVVCFSARPRFCISGRTIFVFSLVSSNTDCETGPCLELGALMAKAVAGVAEIEF